MESSINFAADEQIIYVREIPRLLAFPEGLDYHDPQEGIPLDVYDILYPLFEGASTEFWKTLILSFWDRGLIRKTDFLHPSAHKKIRQSLNVALKHDVLSILATLQENSK